MSTAAVREVVRQIAQDDPPSDAALLTQYTRNRDHEAFAELLHRHGPVVLGVCRRLLANRQDAEDAFQAVFLILARKAASVRPAGMVGNWLYGVAVRTANKAKVAAARRWRREMATAMAPVSREHERPEDSLQRAELRAAIDQELGRLPDHLRAAVVLCDLGGKTRSEAARDLACPEGTIAARLHRARKLLAERFVKRGIALPAAGLTAVLTPEIGSAAVPSELARTTLVAAASFARNATSAISPTVEALAEGVIRTMTNGNLKLVLTAVLVSGLLTGGILWAADRSKNGPPATDPNTTTEVVGLRAIADPPTKPTPASGYVTDVRFSPGGKLFGVVAGGTVTVSVTDFMAQQAGFGPVLMTVPGEAAAFSPDGTTLIVMGPKAVTFHDILTRTVKSYPRPKTNLGWHLVSFSPDGKRYAAHFGSTVRVYDTETGFEPIRLDNQHEPPANTALSATTGMQLLWSANGKQVVAVGVLVRETTMGAAAWDAETGKRLHAFEADFTDGPKSIAFSPDGTVLAVALKHRAVLYDAATFKELRKVHTLGTLSVIGFTPDGLIALGGEVELADGKDPPTYIRRNSVRIEDERKPYGGSSVIDMDTEVNKTALPLSAMAFSPDGKRLVTGTGFPAFGQKVPADAPKVGEVKVWNLSELAAAPGSWKEQKVLEHSGFLVGSTTYSPDGKSLIVGGTDGHVRAYETANLKQLWEHKNGGGKLAAVAFAPDGKTIAATFVAAGKQGVQLLDAATGKAGEILEEEGALRDWPEPLAVAFFPDVFIPGDGGDTFRKVIYGNIREYVVKSWIVRSAKPSTIKSSTVAAGKEPVDRFAIPLAVDPAGNRVLVTGPIDKDTGKNVLWVWSAGSGVANQVLEGHKAAVVSAAWSADGKKIITGDASGIVIVWDGEKFKEKSRLDLVGRVAALAVSGDGKRVAAAAVRKPKDEWESAYLEEIFVWDAASPAKKPKAISSHASGGPFRGVASVSFAPDAKTLVSGFCNFDHLTKLGELRGRVRVFTIEAEAH